MSPLSTAAAMYVTGAQRLKFNEAVSRGHYTCAPDPGRHSYRMFDDAALVGLFIFARLTDDDLPPRLAGRWACEIENVARTRPEVTDVFFAHLTTGRPDIIYGFDEMAQRKDVVRSRHFGLQAILKHIATLLKTIERVEGAPLV